MSDPVLSPKNHRVSELRRLVSQRKARSSERAFAAEGPTLVAEALASPLHVSSVFAEEASDLTRRAESRGARVLLVAEGGLGSVLSTVSPQPVAAVVSSPDWEWNDLADPSHVLVLDDVRDPGNVGTLMRTGEASGCAGVVLTGNCVDPLSPKVVRASAGSVFRIPFLIERDRGTAMERLSGLGHPPVATVVTSNAADYDRCDLSRAAIVLGNEASGLSEDCVALCSSSVTIALAGPTESLNVAGAGSVLCFEALRQRRAANSQTS